MGYDMTREQKKMYGLFGGAIAAVVIFVITVVYAAGGLSREIKFNTERIRRVEITMEKGFDKIYTKLEER